MKELLFSTVREQPNDFMKRSVAREYLQSRILLSLQDHGAFTDWAFLGGTALRFLYQLPRYSEDLDFSLTGRNTDSRFIRCMEGIKFDLGAEAYDVEVKAREQKTVAAAFIKFPGLLFELGISPHADEVLSVKVEIDTNPPAGAVCETRVIRRFSTVNLLHYDRSSLLAGKLHAVLSRKYTKGRDLYDLAWYLSDPTWPSPNLQLLNNALLQTGWKREPLEPESWMTILGKRLDELDWDAALKDVAPFLARHEDRDLVSPTLIKALLAQR